MLKSFAIVAALFHVAHAETRTATAVADPEEAPTPSVTAAAPEQRDGLMFGASLGIGLGVAAEGHVGWMVHPRVAVTGSALAGVPLTNEGERFLLGLAGARVWFAGPAYVDLRMGYARASHADCTAEGKSCIETGIGYFTGLGVELIDSTKFALDVHAELAGGAGEATLVGGLGVSFF